MVTELGELQGNRAYPYPRDAQVDILLRPDDIVIDPLSSYQARVSSRAFMGANILYSLTLSSGNQVLSLAPSHIDYSVNDNVGIKVEADHLVVFAAQ